MRKRQAIDDILGNVPRDTINSKQKGNKNERVAARFLHEWTGYEFVRIPMSGGLRWRNNMNICGDLICTDPNSDWAFSVETKFYQFFSIETVLKSNSAIRKVWRQCSEDAEREGKKPMLMLRYNGMPAGEYYVFMETQLGKKVRDKLCDSDWIAEDYIRGDWTEGKGRGVTVSIRGFKSTTLKRLPYKEFAQLVNNT